MLVKLNKGNSETLDVHGDNLIQDSPEDSDSDDIIEDTEIQIPTALTNKFVPDFLPNKFDKYDLNKDGFIDENELISVTRVIENNKMAMKASDLNGDGKLSRDEFIKGPWDFNDSSSDDVTNESDDDSDIENSSDVTIIDVDSDNFKKVLENIDSSDELTDENKESHKEKRSTDDTDDNDLEDSRKRKVAVGRNDDDDDDNRKKGIKIKKVKVKRDDNWWARFNLVNSLNPFYTKFSTLLQYDYTKCSLIFKTRLNKFEDWVKINLLFD